MEDRVVVCTLTDAKVGFALAEQKVKGGRYDEHGYP